MRQCLCFGRFPEAWQTFVVSKHLVLLRIQLDALEEGGLWVHLPGQFCLPRNDFHIVAVERKTKMID